MAEPVHFRVCTRGANGLPACEVQERWRPMLARKVNGDLEQPVRALTPEHTVTCDACKAVLVEYAVARSGP